MSVVCLFNCKKRAKGEKRGEEEAKGTFLAPQIRAKNNARASVTSLPCRRRVAVIDNELLKIHKRQCDHKLTKSLDTLALAI